LGPQQVVTLTVDPPFSPREQPVLFTPKAGDVLITAATENSVTVANQTDRIAAFMVAIVPRLAVQVATMPWRRVVRDLGTAVQESGVLDQIKRAFKP
jgi:hypothetical protein